jgi:hypothetical protein
MKKPGLVIMLCVLILSSQPVTAAEDIHNAARDGDLAAVQRILGSDPERLDSLDRFKYTPLDWAATRARWDVVRWLVEAGASVRNVGWDGGTVLHRACHYDESGIIQLLLDEGADPGLRNQWGRAALHVAARRDCRKVAAVLIASGIDLLSATHEGWTPLHVAAMSGHEDMMRLLVSSGAAGDAKDLQGKTPREYFRPRPAETGMAPEAYGAYLGHYAGEDGFRVEVWAKQDRIYITDFGFDEMYPTGKDEFFCRHEPWSVKFFRDGAGNVTEMELSFLRRSHRLVRER